MSVIAREKTNEISSWGRGHESVCISLIARVCNNGSLFQSFLYAFRRGATCYLQWRDIRNSKAFAGRESTVTGYI